MVEYAKAPVAPDTYNAACFLAQCVPLIENDGTLFGPVRYLLARQYADRAMDYLRQVMMLDYKYAAQMRTDPDFAPLRGRPDFRRLMSELESRSKHREPAPPPRPAKP
jgi:hypothetical protein